MKKLVLSTFLAFCSTVTFAQSNYSFTNIEKTTTTYTDISGSGTEILMTDPESGSSATTLNIGFDFTFNGTVFNQCVIHADGILRFGTVATSGHKDLFTNNGSSSESVYTTINSNYQNVVFAFFMDLVQGSAVPNYHILTEGIAPNRVTTIQWKNLKDNNNSGSTLESQFDNLEFQVKLFETTNNIEIIYGDFLPSGNEAIGRIAQIGLKGASNSFIGSKRSNSATPFAFTEFLDPSGHSENTSTMPIRKTVIPQNGFAFIFYGKQTTDVGIAEAYVEKSVSKTLVASTNNRVRVKNEGLNIATNINVTLNITGANTFSQTINIPSLAPGTDQVVDFIGYALSNIGEQNIQFSVNLAGDENAANNTLSKQQTVTNNFVEPLARSASQSSGFGFNGSGNNEVALKIYGSGTRKISQIRVPFSTFNVSVNLRILEDNGANNTPGTVLFTSVARFTNSDNETIFNITPTTVTGDYFIAIRQNSTSNMGWLYESQYPTNPNRIYNGNGFTYTLQPVNSFFHPLVKVVEESDLPDVGITAVTNPLCGYDVNSPITVTLRNYSSSIHDFAVNPVTINGTITSDKTNLSVPFSIVKSTGTLAAGATEPIVVGLNYDMSERASHKFVVSTAMINDTEPKNDTLTYQLVNNVKFTNSASGAICPFTAVTLTAPTNLYSSVKWEGNGVLLRFDNSVTFSPFVTTIVKVTAVDYRGCTLIDSVKIEVSQNGLPLKPIINTADTVLSYRNGFTNTLNIAALAGHTINWISGGTISNAGQNNRISGFRGIDPENHLVYYKNEITLCGSNPAQITSRFADGILMNNNNNETITDTSFYDRGGAIGTNNGSDNFTKTFYPALAGDKLKLSIYYIELGQFSTLEIYDGIDANSPRIGRLNRLTPNSLSEYMASNSNGALTIVFKAGGNTAPGWLAGITSEKPLQFRTVQNGLFDDFNIWESKLPLSTIYIPAIRRPFKGDDLIEIKHALTLEPNSVLPLDQTVIETTGSLMVPAQTSIDLYSDGWGYELTVKGTLTVDGFVTGNRNPGVNGKLSLEGTLNISGIIEVDSLIITPTLVAAVINASGNAEIRKLKMSNPNGLNLTGNLQISRGLAMENGIITITNPNFISMKSGNNPVIEGGSALSYINGKLRRQTFPTSDSLSFPVGKNGIYRKITLLADQNGSDDFVEYEAELFAVAPASRTLAPSLTNVNQQWYHNISITVGESRFERATVTVDYLPTDGITNAVNLHLAKDDGGVNWQDIAGTSSNGETSGTITSEYFTSLGDFVLANIDNLVLPVKLITFKAKLINSTVQLNWQVAQEKNFYGYDVERSLDGINFSKIGFVSSTDQNELTNYSFNDISFIDAGTYYYRLKMIDSDGTFVYSHLSSVNLPKFVSRNPLSVSPNPFTDYLIIHYNAKGSQTIQVQLTDMSGKILKIQTYDVTKGENELRLEVNNLSQASYLLTLVAKEEILTDKVIKK